MNKKIIVFSATSILWALPLAVFALNYPPFNPGGPINVKSLADSILGFVWPLFLAFATLMFIIAGFTFLSANGEPGKIANAKKAFLWGIVGVAVGIAAFSIVHILSVLITLPVGPQNNPG